MRCAGEVKNVQNDWISCPGVRLQGSDFCRRTDHRRWEDDHNDPVNPSYYQRGGIEAINVIEAYGLGFCAGNALKYLLRYRFKGRPLEDLRKARWYLDREISNGEDR